MSFGKVGPTGEPGFVGIRGNSGNTGYGGITGYPGEFYIGPTFTGATGYNGYQGERGFTGQRGDTGINGNAGGTGLMGNTTIGAQGPQGPRGGTGITGNYLLGTQGIAGPNGSTGYTGSTGIKGNTGNTGYRGYQGPDGYIFLDTLPAYTGYTGVVLPMPVCANNSEASLSSLALVTRLNNAVNTQGFIQEDFLITSGTYVIPNNTYEVDVEIQGGGGGGGGSSTSDVGGGGGGSGFNVTKRMLVTPGQSFAYTIGNGGNGGLSGSDGTASVFGAGNATITALGGKGGAVGLSNIQGGNGGTGGFGGGGGYINNILYPTRNNQTLYQMDDYGFLNGYYFADATTAVMGNPAQLPGPLPLGITQHVISQSGDRIIFNGSAFILNPVTNEWEQSNILTSEDFNNETPRMYKSRGSVDGTLQMTLLTATGGAYADSGKLITPTWTQGNILHGVGFGNDYTEIGPRAAENVGSTGYTAIWNVADNLNTPMLRNLSNFIAISNDKKYFAVGGGGFSGNAAGPTGAVWTYFLGPTGVVDSINRYPMSFNTQLTDPALRMTNSTISFSEPITAGWEGTLLIGGLNNSFQNAAVLWEVGTGTWAKRQTITSSVQGSTGEWYIGPLTRDVFYTQTEGGLYTLRYMKYPNLTFGTASIVFQYPYSVSYSVSTDGNFVYVFNNTLINVAFYQKQPADTSFTLRYTIPLPGINNFYGTGVGYRLFGPFDNIASSIPPVDGPMGLTGYKSYVPPNGAGVGGSSQHSYISAGASGTVSAGGAGTMNGNVKPVPFNASGGGFGGGFDDAGAASNSGGGGTGRVSQPGTSGGSGYIKVRRFNPGV